MLVSQTLTNIIMEIFSQTCNLRLDLNFFFLVWVSSPAKFLIGAICFYFWSGFQFL